MRSLAWVRRTRSSKGSHHSKLATRIHKFVDGTAVLGVVTAKDWRVVFSPG